MNEQDVLGAFLLVNNPIVLSEEETKDVQKAIENLQQENQELKKQLEEINKFKFSYRKDETKIPPIIRKQKDVEIIKNLRNQQKEFINYLQEELNVQIQQESIGCETTNKKYILEEILQKYKSIIGVSDDKTN